MKRLIGITLVAAFALGSMITITFADVEDPRRHDRTDKVKKIVRVDRTKSDTGSLAASIAEVIGD